MDRDSLGARLGLTAKDLEKLNKSEEDIRLGLQALETLEQLGLRNCEERDDCQAMLNQVEQLRNRIFGSPLASAQ